MILFLRRSQFSESELRKHGSTLYLPLERGFVVVAPVQVVSTVDCPPALSMDGTRTNELVRSIRGGHEWSSSCES